MRVVVTGGTGFIGAPLCQALVAAGHSVVVLSREPARALARLGGGVDAVAWNPGKDSAWQRTLDGADAVVNLAGRSIATRWTPDAKAAIRTSRVEGTRALVQAIERAEPRPSVLVNASAVGYYGPRGEEVVPETDPPGDDFLASVCREWEAEALIAETHGVRVALVRTGVVLGRGGGALQPMLVPFKLFVGGPIGNGRQGFPWVHLDDVVGLYRWALETDSVKGALNGTGPQARTNAEFSHDLAQVLGRPCWLPAPGFALKLLLGEMAESLLLQGQKAQPVRTRQLGFQFKFETAEAALRNVLPR